MSLGLKEDLYCINNNLCYILGVLIFIIGNAVSIITAIIVVIIIAIKLHSKSSSWKKWKKICCALCIAIILLALVLGGSWWIFTLTFCGCNGCCH